MAQVLQGLTQQLLAERAEKQELQDMLEQEDKELQSAISAKQSLEIRLDELSEQVCASLHCSVPCKGK